MIWNTVEQDFNWVYNFGPCTNDTCPYNALAEIPASLIVDYVKIHERIYEFIDLEIDSCFNLCDSIDFCVNLNYDILNFCYNNVWDWADDRDNEHNPSAQPGPEVINWNTSSNLDVSSSDDEEICFEYTGPDCSVSPCLDQALVNVSFVVPQTGDTLTQIMH